MPELEPLPDCPMFLFWLPYNGKQVTIDGLRCVIKVSQYEGRYPYRRKVVNAWAVPNAAAQRTEKYREQKQRLGDDWFIDLLLMDDESYEQLFKQLGAKL